MKITFLNQPGYCVHRNDSIESVYEQLEEKDVVILQSKLGNGKTIFLECLANNLLENYNVYFLRNLENYVDDLQLILSNENRCSVIMIDDYGNYVQFVKELGKDFPDHLKLVMTCRTAININLYYDLTEKYGYPEEKIGLCDLDTMSDGDITDLVKVFDMNRLWGKLDTMNPSQKKRKYEKSMVLIYQRCSICCLNRKSLKNSFRRLLMY